MTRKHKYPSNRRSPIPHKVKSFKRGKFTVKGHARGSGKVLGKVSRVVSRAVKGVGQEGVRLHKKLLLEECFTGTKAQRLSAKIALRENYPELWIEAGFTDEMDMRRKAPDVILIKPRKWERSTLPY